jgi:hypothetical protein
MTSLNDGRNSQNGVNAPNTDQNTLPLIEHVLRPISPRGDFVVDLQENAGVVSDTEQDSTSIAANIDKIKAQLSADLKHCVQLATDYSEQKSASDFQARQCLILVRKIIVQYGCEKVGAELGIRNMAVFKRNPYSPTLKYVHQKRDPKIISRQSLALRYALTQTDGDVQRLEDYFKKFSISQCLEAHYLEQRTRRLNGALPATRSVLVQGLPDDLVGVVTVQIKITGKRAVYIPTVASSSPKAVTLSYFDQISYPDEKQ